VLELLEDARLILRRDADARVTDRDHGITVRAARDHVDPSPVGGELDGIGQQVEEHLFHLARVGLDEIEVRRDVERHLDRVPACALADHGDAVVQSLDEREAVHVEVHPTGFDLG